MEQVPRAAQSQHPDDRAKPPYMTMLGSAVLLGSLLSILDAQMTNHVSTWGFVPLYFAMALASTVRPLLPAIDPLGDWHLKLQVKLISVLSSVSFTLSLLLLLSRSSLHPGPFSLVRQGGWGGELLLFLLITGVIISAIVVAVAVLVSIFIRSHQREPLSSFSLCLMSWLLVLFLLPWLGPTLLAT